MRGTWLRSGDDMTGGSGDYAAVARQAAMRGSGRARWAWCGKR